MISGLARRARWYIDRARVMPPGEWLHRLRQAVLIAAERRRSGRLALPAPQADPGWARPLGAPALVGEAEVAAVAALPGAVDAARERAGAPVEGRVRYFGYPEIEVGPHPDWNRDGPSGADWPLAHWSTVNHRELGLDPKWVWELGRHQDLVALARAWRLTGEERYARAACHWLEGFLAQCPPGSGIHWRSGLELGVRLISWAWAVELLRGAAPLSELRDALLGSVGAHLDHLARYPSRYSSANNHLVGEAAGRAVGGLCFPELPGAADHARAGLRELEEALEAQVLPDGVDAEQAVGYHGFVLELGLAPVACLRRLGEPVPEGILRALTGIAGFLGTLASDALTLPRIGDEDEGLGVDLGPRLSDPERLRFRLRAAKALLEVELPRQEPGLDEPTVWLAGAERAAAAGAAARRAPGSAAFPHGGYVVLRSRGPGGGEVRAVLDAGPLGLAPMAAHGHADLLSVCLAVDGEEALVDPGTFTYFGEERWREYGRSTGAHSTVRLDGRDQAETAGRFLWRTRPGAVLDRIDLGERQGAATGFHDAYAPVRHQRRVALAGRALVVVDTLSGPPGVHEVEARWHLGPGQVVRRGEAWRWSGRRSRLTIQVEGLGEQRIARGEEDGPLGFVSAGLERREPSPTLVAREHVALPARIVTRIEAPVA